LRELLPADRRTVVDLKAEGLSTGEIAERLGLGERTVRRVMADLRRKAGMDDAEEGT
jgi:RNA polymerase sigma-70 factor (ECF subfamily)